MANREQRLARATWWMGRDLDDAAGELRHARRRAGLTAQAVASVLGVSHPTVLRNERGYRGIPPILLARHAAVVGLRARIRLYPEGEAIRDAGQVALIRRFREQVGEPGSWAFEVPIPRAGNQRALDAVLTVAGGRIGLEFYTRLADVQAQLRAANLKKRDAELERLVVVVQATRANRRALREAGTVLVDFPRSGRRLLTAMAAGELPPANGVILF
ncbi:MAG: helix-turn-helix transcriptional regulator [Chloroflexota bacterium]